MILEKSDVHYQAIKTFYGGGVTKRYNIPLMNHIDEGLQILGRISTGVLVQQAFCIHPLLQSDENLKETLYKAGDIDIESLGVRPAILAMEYRNQLNRFSSKTFDKGGSADRRTAKVNELKSIMVNNPLLHAMAVADKVQNRKDFEKYHKGNHPRSKELVDYFYYWLYFILGVTEREYLTFVQELHSD